MEKLSPEQQERLQEYLETRKGYSVNVPKK